MKRILALITLGIVVACGTSDSESLGTSSSSLDLPDGSPQPKAWDGSAVDLLVADAWAACSFVDPGHTKWAEVGNIDRYLGHVLAEVQTSSVCANVLPDPNPLKVWYETRKEPTCNTNRSGQDQGFEIPPATLFGLYDGAIVPSNVNDAVDDIIRKPSVNLCIAHRLRAAAPGGAGVATLTLNGAEQRELAEMTRQRAQLAVLGYDAVWEVAAAPRTNPQNPTTVIEKVQAVLDQDGILFGGDQLADAMQLLTVTTDEVLDLYLRSASARIPRTGNTPESLPADIWGNGSWRSRAFVSLYGGDSLAPVGLAEILPWPYFNGSPSMEPTFPFVATDAREPQVDELNQYARRYDALALRMQPPVALHGGCYEVDVALAASRLYRAVEAGLRTDGCEQHTQVACLPVDISTVPDPAQGVADFLLWKEHRISLDHATLLVRQLADQIGRKCEHEQQTYERVGAANVLGRASITTLTNQGLQGAEDGDYYHLDKATILHPHTDLAEYQGVYRGGGFTTQASIFAGVDPDNLQEYPASDFVWEYRRQAGSVRTLAATRRVLDLAKSSSFTPDALRGHFTDLLDLTAASAGTTSVSYEPVLALSGAPAKLEVVERQAVIYAPADDPFWNPAQAADVALLIVQDNPLLWAVNDVLIPALLSDPSFHGFTGVDLTDRLTHLFGSSSGPALTVDSLDGPKIPLKRWTFQGFPTQGLVAGYMLARKGSGPTAEYRLMAGPIAGDVFHGSFGGTLNEVVARSIVPQTENPSQPFYDAFGLPVRLFPSTDPYLAGGTSAASATKIYLDNAHKAADAAVSAVTIAFQTLLQQEKDTADVNAQVARSAQVIDSNRKQLCGDNNPGCITDIVEFPILRSQNLVHLTQLIADCTNLSLTADQRALACFVRDTFKKYYVNVRIGQAVVQVLMGNGSPSFVNYQGGSLQGVYIEQWSDYGHLGDQLDEYYTAYQLARTRVEAAKAAADAVDIRAKSNCSPAAMITAAASGVSGGFASVSVSIGPLIAQIQKCHDLNTEAAPAQAQLILAFTQGMDDMHQVLMRVADAGKQLGLAVAAGSVQAESAKLAEERAALDKTLATSTSPSNGDLFRRYHSYELWRARALVENARRYAIVARRSIEGRYVVDLSALQAPEPFVSSPSNWADQVYEYDLNMPAAVGLTIGSQQTTGSIYPNVVVDYVDNLQRFVDGFVIQRPTASAQSDTEVMSLPGPRGIGDGAQLPQGVLDAESYKWSFYCPNQAVWTPVPDSGDVDGVCGLPVKPSLARLRFNLDPWGRIDGALAQEPYQARYNTRWSRFAFNLVGTGVMDCTKAKDPLSCYSQSFVRYDLSHVGPAWTTNFEQAWRALEVPMGRVEGGKALAAEQWLDPLSNAWSKPFVTQITRNEFLDRPLGGAYDVTFTVGPEVVLSRIDRVQLLAEEAYWTKQK